MRQRLLAISVVCTFGTLVPLAPMLGSADPGQELYEAGCAKCHGLDGTGVREGEVAFSIETPDFTDCSFSSREPDGDWIAVAHQGGPVRAFDQTMPAFGEAFTVEQLQTIMDYIRGFCTDQTWPRGELNLPRPFLTEKAFPEDEAVFVTRVNAEGPTSVVEEVVYEKRFGSQNQIELKVPFGIVDATPAGGGPGGSEAFLGNIDVGLKRVLFHSLHAGTILSVGGEAKLPTSTTGSNSVAFEPFVSLGQILPNDAFIHMQGVIDIPTASGAALEAKWRGVIGRSLTQGEWGRAWTPMFETQIASELESGSALEVDVVPQIQFTMNTRQHIIGNLGIRIPVTETSGRPAQLLFYVLWDWFDGGFFDGW